MEEPYESTADETADGEPILQWAGYPFRSGYEERCEPAGLSRRCTRKGEQDPGYTYQ
jgi:hypothetical protein